MILNNNFIWKEKTYTNMEKQTNPVSNVNSLKSTSNQFDLMNTLALKVANGISFKSNSDKEMRQIALTLTNPDMSYESPEKQKAVKKLEDPKVLKGVFIVFKQLMNEKEKEVEKEYKETFDKKTLQRWRAIQVQKFHLDQYIKSADKQIAKSDKSISFKGSTYFKPARIDEDSFDIKMQEELQDKGKKAKLKNYMNVRGELPEGKLAQSIAFDNILQPPMNEIIEGEQSLLHKEAIGNLKAGFEKVNLQRQKDRTEKMAEIKEAIHQAIADSMEIRHASTNSITSQVVLQKSEEKEIEEQAEKTTDKFFSKSKNRDFRVENTAKAEAEVGVEAHLFNISGHSSLELSNTLKTSADFNKQTRDEVRNIVKDGYKEAYKTFKAESSSQSTTSTKGIEIIRRPINPHTAAKIHGMLTSNEFSRAHEENKLRKDFVEEIENANLVFRAKEMLMQGKTSKKELLASLNSNDNLEDSLDAEQKAQYEVEDGYTDEAIEYYEEALDSRADFLKEDLGLSPDKDIVTGQINKKIGDLYVKTDNPEKAEKYYDKAVKIGRKACINRDPALVKLRQDVGNYYLSQGKVDKAEPLLERAYKVLPADSQQKMPLLDSLIKVKTITGDKDGLKELNDKKAKIEAEKAEKARIEAEEAEKARIKAEREKCVTLEGNEKTEKIISSGEKDGVGVHLKEKAQADLIESTQGVVQLESSSKAKKIVSSGMNESNFGVDLLDNSQADLIECSNNVSLSDKARAETIKITGHNRKIYINGQASVLKEIIFTNNDGKIFLVKDKHGNMPNLDNCKLIGVKYVGEIG